MKKLLLLLLTITTVSLSAATLPNFPFIKVEGSATKEVKPNEVVISFSTEVFDKRSDSANQILVERGRDILKVLKDNAVSVEKLVSDEVDKRTVRKEDRNYRETNIIGYELSQSFQLKLDDLSKYEAITNGLLNLDNLVSVNSNFDVSNREKLESELVREAITKAKRKADNLAAGAGVSIISVHAINQDRSFNTNAGSFGAYDGVEEVIVTGSRIRRNYNLFVPKTIKLNENVSLIYKISP